MKQPNSSSKQTQPKKKQKVAKNPSASKPKVQQEQVFAVSSNFSDSDDDNEAPKNTTATSKARRALDSQFSAITEANKLIQQKNKADIEKLSKKQQKESESEDDNDDGSIPLPEIDVNTSFNPLLDAFVAWSKKAPDDMDSIFDPDLKESRRQALMDMLPILSQDKYAWAIPTTKCIEIMFHLGPIVEVGAGKGYWGFLLRRYAAHKWKNNSHLEYPQLAKLKNPNDVYRGYDCQPTPTKDENIHHLNALAVGAKKFKKFGEEPMKYVKDKKYHAWTHIDIGNAEVLAKHADHTLFLCYPDGFEFSEESLAYNCLEQFQGQYIITVGEWLGQTLQENPFGRSADGEFQQYLCNDFHQILQLSIPSWPTSYDTFCVWKRTDKILLDQSEDDNGMVFRHIPYQERLQVVAAAPCMNEILHSVSNISDNDILLSISETEKVDKLETEQIPESKQASTTPTSKKLSATPTTKVTTKPTKKTIDPKNANKKNALLKQAVADAKKLKSSQSSEDTLKQPIKRKKPSN